MNEKAIGAVSVFCARACVRGGHHEGLDGYRVDGGESCTTVGIDAALRRSSEIGCCIAQMTGGTN